MLVVSLSPASLGRRVLSKTTTVTMRSRKGLLLGGQRKVNPEEDHEKYSTKMFRSTDPERIRMAHRTCTYMTLA